MLWDLAGSKNYRKVWHSYYEEANMIIFMLDGSAADKLQDTKEALEGALEDQNLKGKLCYFLINKNVSQANDARIRMNSTRWCSRI